MVTPLGIAVSACEFFFTKSLCGQVSSFSDLGMWLIGDLSLNVFLDSNNEFRHF